jgi:hypothetical protein
MAKKRKMSGGLPKRIAGVKLPKTLRRAASTPLGSAIIAQAMVEAGKGAARNPRVREAFADLRSNLARAALNIAGGAENAIRDTRDRMIDAADAPPRRRKERFEEVEAS